jgi:hypothetical protein
MDSRILFSILDLSPGDSSGTHWAFPNVLDITLQLSTRVLADYS